MAQPSDIAMDQVVIEGIVEQLWASYPDPTGRVLNVLNDVQERFRYLPEAALRSIAEKEGVPLGRIKRMGEFFEYLSLMPVGRVIIDVCDGTACHTQGAVGLVREFERILGIKVGQTTSDGLMTLRTVGCVGACGIAPVVVVDESAYGRVRVTQVADVVATAQSLSAEPSDEMENGGLKA